MYQSLPWPELDNMNAPKYADCFSKHLWKNESFVDAQCIQAWCHDGCHLCNKWIFGVYILNIPWSTVLSIIKKKKKVETTGNSNLVMKW